MASPSLGQRSSQRLQGFDALADTEGEDERETDEGFVFKRGREVAALLLFTTSIYTSLALLSLRADPHDPGVMGANWVGPVGAALAQVLAQGFGIVAWLLPFELVLHGIPLFRGRDNVFSALRFAGDLLIAILLSALVRVSAPHGTAFGELPVAGNVGLFFGEILQALFSSLGSYLIATTAIALILIGRSSFSFIEFCNFVLEVAENATRRSGSLSRRLYSAWREAQALRRERASLQREAALPVIDGSARDQAILAQLEDDSDWIPIEQTGSPPLAVSAALRSGFGLAQELRELDDSETPAAAPARVLGTAPAKRAKRKAGEAPSRTARASAAVSVDDEGEQDPEQDELAGEEFEADADDGDLAEAAAQSARSETEREANGSAKKRTRALPTIVDTRHLQEIKRGDKAEAPRRAKTSRGYLLPSSTMLQRATEVATPVDRERVLELAARLEKTLADYGVVGKVEEIHPGPTVTTYEFSPQAGTKVSKVSSLADDLALGLSRKVRIIAPIPGKARIGFELPNDERTPVNLRELIEDKRFEKLAEKAPLPVVLGRDIVGAPYYADLASMPHVIVAGATGAGKSVGLNVMLSSLLFRRTPDELRLLMIDPKVVELAPFDGIPHMLLPVVTDMKQAATALKWAVDEMERRYQAFATAGTKNITTYNAWVQRVEAGDLAAPKASEVTALDADGSPVSVPAAKQGSDGSELPAKLPYIVIVVDEFADLMMQQGKEVESAVARLAQKARAAGMHVVLATQRPSVDVITGMIKANFPTRIAFRVAQKVDSRTILDEQGAEHLLGKGDMLVKMNGMNDMRRVQCPFISEEEVSLLTDHLRAQGAPVYHEDILKDTDEEGESGEDEPLDARFDEAVRIVADTQRCSTSWLQRKMTIGYNRAAKIVETMEKKGMVGPPNGARDREIFVSPQ